MSGSSYDEYYSQLNYAASNVNNSCNFMSNSNYSNYSNTKNSVNTSNYRSYGNNGSTDDLRSVFKNTGYIRSTTSNEHLRTWNK